MRSFCNQGLRKKIVVDDPILPSRCRHVKAQHRLHDRPEIVHQLLSRKELPPHPPGVPEDVAMPTAIITSCERSELRVPSCQQCLDNNNNTPWNESVQTLARRLNTYRAAPRVQVCLAAARAATEPSSSAKPWSTSGAVAATCDKAMLALSEHVWGGNEYMLGACSSGGSS